MAFLLAPVIVMASAKDRTYCVLLLGFSISSRIVAEIKNGRGQWGVGPSIKEDFCLAPVPHYTLSHEASGLGR